MLWKICVLEEKLNCLLVWNKFSISNLNDFIIELVMINNMYINVVDVFVLK